MGRYGDIFSDTEDENAEQNNIFANSDPDTSESDTEADQDEVQKKTVQLRKNRKGPVVGRTVIYQGRTLKLKEVQIKLERCEARQGQEGVCRPAGPDQCRAHGIRKTVQIRLERCDNNPETFRKLKFGEAYRLNRTRDASPQPSGSAAASRCQINYSVNSRKRSLRSNASCTQNEKRQ
ncbi:unnamed protein product [Orchesella dallaii]|uniref:Uncharacterized protein n=1 Tax=Orchesella dallaii TaxID=48710 RepID=A0ABP1RMV6_9HEXA